MLLGWTWVLVAAGVGCGSTEPAGPVGAQVPPVGFSLAFSSRVDGEIEPCG